MNTSDLVKRSLNTDFVGRKYAFEQIEKLWAIPAGQPRSMFFWGDWFTGKSEVLWNIDKHCRQQVNTAYTSLQRLGGGRESKYVWQMLSDEVELVTAIKAPSDNTLLANPYIAFAQYIKKVFSQKSKDYRLLLAIDQYEGFLDIPDAAAVLKDLEALTLKHDRLAFLLCGSHDIGGESGKADIDFNPTLKLRLGAFTKEETAEYCNQQPYKFDPDAIARLYELTGGQPWLVRGLCFNIISEFNWSFEKAGEIRSNVTIFDVEYIAGSNRFYENYNSYFSSLWNKQISCGYTTLQQVLSELAGNPDGMTVADIDRSIDFRRTYEIVDVCQMAMNRHAGSLIEKANDSGNEIYRVAIELFRRWIIRTQK